MAQNFYEILGVAQDATTEQIRRAYKQKALQTHPDKLPLGLSEPEKSRAAEKFKEISHACEILADSERRKVYDEYGVWPLPESKEEFDSHRGPYDGRSRRGFDSPFSTHPRHSAHSDFDFKDPIKFFDAVFRNLNELSASLHSNAFGPSPVMPQGMPFPSPLPPMFMAPLAHEGARGSRSHSSQSERYVSRTVNGVTSTIHTTWDNDGNEYVTWKTPDGSEVYTINGIAQPSRHHINVTAHHSSAAQISAGQRYNTPVPSFHRAHGQPSAQPVHHDSLRGRPATSRYTSTAHGDGRASRKSRQ